MWNYQPRDEEEEEGEDDSFESRYLTPRNKLDLLQTIIRLILNVFAGGMMAKGYGNRERWEQGTAAAVIVGTLAWGVLHQRIQKKRWKKLNKQKDRNVINDPEI